MNKKKTFVVKCGLVIFLIVSATYACFGPPYMYSSELMEAIYDNNIEEARRILETYHFDVNTPDSKPNRILNTLLESTPETPLVVACKCGNYEMVKLLIDYGATGAYIQGTAWSPLEATYLYTDEDDYRITQLLLQSGADVNYAWNRELTPVMAATDMEPMFFNFWRDGIYEGENVYDESAAEMICNIVQLLIENGADISKNGKGYSICLLGNATKTNNVVLMSWLVEEYGMDINSRNMFNQTALFYVTQNESYYKQTLDYLLSRGIDKSIKDDYEKTAYDYALEREEYELAAMIKP